MSKEELSKSTNGKEYRQELSDYCDEFERQISTYIKLGFHKLLGTSLQEYLSSIPDFKPPSKNITGRFDKVLLVEPRVPVWLQLQTAGYKYFINSEVRDSGDNKHQLPYTTWLQDGSKKELRSLHAPDERDMTIQEGAALLIAYPKAIENHPIALFGSSLISTNEKPRRIPCIYKWSDGQIGMGADYVGYLEDDGARPATCGIVETSTLS